MSGLFYTLGLNPSQFIGGLGAAQGALGGFQNHATSLTATVAKLTAGMAAAGAAAAAFVGIRGSKLAAEFESISMAMTTLVGDAAQASALLSRIEKYADNTSFEFPELAGAAKMLLGMGSAAGDVSTELAQMGDLAAGLGVAISDIALVFGQARASNQLMGGDMLQLAAKGIPAYKMIAEMLGMEVSEVKKLGEAGKLTFPLLQEAFKKLTGEGGKFFNMALNQSKTTEGRMSTLKDGVNKLFRQFGEPINDALRPMLEEINANYLPKLSAGLATTIAAMRKIAADGKIGLVLASSFGAANAYAMNLFEGLGRYLGDVTRAGLQWAFANAVTYGGALGTGLQNIFTAASSSFGALLRAAGYSMGAAVIGGMVKAYDFITALPDQLWNGMKAGVDGFLALLSAGWAKLIAKIPGMAKSAASMNQQAAAFTASSATATAARAASAAEVNPRAAASALEKLAEAAKGKAAESLINLAGAINQAKDGVMGAQGTPLQMPEFKMGTSGDGLIADWKKLMDGYWTAGKDAVDAKKEADEEAGKALDKTKTSAGQSAQELDKAKKQATGVAHEFGKVSKAAANLHGGDEGTGRRRIKGYVPGQDYTGAAPSRAAEKRQRAYGGIGSQYLPGGGLDYLYGRAPAYSRAKTVSQRAREAWDRRNGGVKGKGNDAALAQKMEKHLADIAANTAGLKVV